METNPKANSEHSFSASVAACDILVALLVGTGGSLTGNYYETRGDKGYVLARYDVSVFRSTPDVERTPADDLSHVRDVFKFSVTEMASLFDVSRQAIYDWQSGKTIAASNQIRLQDVARAADMIQNANIENARYLSRRKIADGKTFIDMVRAGESAEKCAGDLIAMLQHESDQRARLDALLGPRKDRKFRSIPIGAPILGEKG
ncbi:MAG: hypothetical protein FWD68_06865 [Alphaproteobacteria bacterium]|nr:hypothetical protein [Alphaproteobacteria bacterium]